MYFNCCFIFNFQNVMAAFMAKTVQRFVEIASGKINVSSWTVPVLMDATVAIGENDVQKVKKDIQNNVLFQFWRTKKQVIII